MDRVGTDVHAHPIVGDRSHGHDLARIGAVDPLGHPEVDREEQLVRVRSLHQGARHLDPIVLDQRGSRLHALGTEEGEHHGSADEESIDPRQEVLDHVDLTRDLRAPEHGEERSHRLVERPAEVAELRLHEESGYGRRKVMGDPLGRGVGPVGGAERVVHVALGQRGERPGELGIVGLLLRVEAEVLQEQTGPRLDRPGPGLGCLPHAIVDECDLAPEELPEPGGDRGEGATARTAARMDRGYRRRTTVGAERFRYS